MFKDIQVTLYDFFGYLLPGAVILVAAVLIFWTLFWPNASLPLPSSLPVLATSSLVFAAYLAGHLGQALGNLLEKVSPGRRNLDKKLPLSPELGKEVVHALAGRFGEQIKTLDEGNVPSVRSGAYSLRIARRARNLHLPGRLLSRKCGGPCILFVRSCGKAYVCLHDGVHWW